MVAKLSGLARIFLSALHPRTLGIVRPPPHDQALHGAIAEFRGANRDRPLVPRTESVVTRMAFSAAPAEVWKQLLFYEQIDRLPPLQLRLLLPVPVAALGRKSQVGDESRCCYQTGHLVKRVMEIDRGRRYRFEVVEQALDIGGGIRLSGGEYLLRDLPGDRTEVSLSTRYLGNRRPRWLWRRIESAVCHVFHGYILATMRRNLEPR